MEEDLPTTLTCQVCERSLDLSRFNRGQRKRDDPVCKNCSKTARLEKLRSVMKVCADCGVDKTSDCFSNAQRKHSDGCCITCVRTRGKKKKEVLKKFKLKCVQCGGMDMPRFFKDPNDPNPVCMMCEFPDEFPCVNCREVRNKSWYRKSQLKFVAPTCRYCLMMKHPTCVVCEKRKNKREFEWTNGDSFLPENRTCESCANDIVDVDLNGTEEIFFFGVDDNNTQECALCKEKKILDDFTSKERRPGGICLSCRENLYSSFPDTRQCSTCLESRDAELFSNSQKKRIDPKCMICTMGTHRKCSACQKSISLNQFSSSNTDICKACHKSLNKNTKGSPKASIETILSYIESARETLDKEEIECKLCNKYKPIKSFKPWIAVLEYPCCTGCLGKHYVKEFFEIANHKD